MHGVSLPRGPRDVDAAWMTSLLRAVGLLGSDADVASLALEAPESQGNAGGALRARLRYAPPSAKSPETLIVKLAPEGEEAGRGELREKVRSVLQSLPEEYRLPLTLRYLDGADYETITQQLGLTGTTLRGVLHRGLQLLRKAVKQEIPHESR